MIVNGGSELVRDGRVYATLATDGMVRPGGSGLLHHGWWPNGTPRTIAGVDRDGRILLVTVDGCSTGSLGLLIAESAVVACVLGMRDVVGLGGGGSTTMAAG